MDGILTATKLHGAENDFFFIQATQVAHRDLASLRKLAVDLCHRRRGLGADGVVVWESLRNRISLLIINSDGSFAGTCGNALRCLALLCLEQGLWDGASLLPVQRHVPKHNPGTPLSDDEVFVTKPEIFAVLSSATLVAPGRAIASVVMGQERSLAVDLPATTKFLPLLEPHFPDLFRPSYDEHTDLPPHLIEAGQRHTLEHVRIDLSNPHWVFYSSAFEKFTERDFINFGELAQKELRLADPHNPQPVCNIGMASPCDGPRDEHAPAFRLTVYERGAGLTPCCGSGATAARAMLEALGAVTIDTDSVVFHMLGGVVSIEWTEDAPLHRVLTGPAERITTVNFG